MRKLYLLLIVLVVAFVQVSCKDFWHPEGPTPDPKADYATITLRNYNTNNYDKCRNAILLSINTGNSYEFPKTYHSGGYISEGSLKVPTGTYYITTDNAHNAYSGSVRSVDFIVEERGVKIVTYYRSGPNGRELRL